MSKGETREQRIIAWTKAGHGDATYDNEGSPNGPGDTSLYEDEVYWGVWWRVGGETSYPPDVIFNSEKEAEAYATFIARQRDAQEWHVGPCVLSIAARDNYEVPE